MKKLKIALLYLFVGFTIPTIFLLNAFLVPEPYSHPLIYVAKSPEYLFNFILNREILDSLSLLILGYKGQNDGEIAIILFTIFWFFASMFGLFLVRYILKTRRFALK